MPAIDARATTTGPVHDTDICIVGTGPAAMTLARSLPASCGRITLIESGGLDPDPDLHALNETIEAGYPRRREFMDRVRLFGGSSNLWPGRCMTLQPWDLEPRDWITHSGWPISFPELAAYYPIAARQLGLPTAAHPVLAGTGTGTGTGTAGNDTPGLFTPELWRDLAVWARKPWRIGAAQWRDLHRDSRRTLLFHLSALEITLTPDGAAVESLRAASTGGTQMQVRARTFVLAAGTLENTRLLLASRGHSAQGVGNPHDQLGRYYMDHPRAVIGRVRVSPKARLGDLLGKPLPDGRLKSALVLAPTVQRAEGLAGCLLELEPSYTPGSTLLYGTALETLRRLYRRRYGCGPDAKVPFRQAAHHLYQVTLREIMPHRLYHWTHQLKKQRAGELVVVAHCEQMPNPQSRLSLSDRRDRHDIPLLRVDWRVGDTELHSASRTLQLLDERLGQLGAGRLIARETDILFGDAAHPMGSTRMSRDPRRGVVDSDCRVHGIANLYVAGGSVFPTGGYANPTLTIVALALRLAEHLGRTSRCRTN
jgi:choline dehydrogenase-like flavoprotein